MLIIGAISPVVVKCDAGFPRKRIACHIPYSFRWYHLLRGSKVSRIGGRLECLDRASILCTALKTVINYDVWLDGANHFHKFLSLPLVAFHISIREVKPHKVQMSVVGKKLFYLSKHIVKVAVKVSVFITVLFVIPHWMVHIAVMREVLVSPVNY